SANEHLEQLALIDPLSGLANRRNFDETLVQTGRTRSGQAPGRIAHDRRRSFQAVQRSLRACPARYGGEEFAVLLAGASLGGARLVADRLRHAVEELCIAHAGSPLGQVTVSVGAASLVPSLGDSAKGLIEGRR